MKKNILLILILFLMFSFAFSFSVSAQENIVDYGQDPVLDMDLDGLTDAGERDIYHTDPTNPDTDGDGSFDGTEILNNTNPLDSSSTINVPDVSSEDETPWAWYISRVTGLISFALLYIVMLTALTIRLPFFHKILAPIHALNIHRWLSIQALLFVAAHGVALLFDEYIGFGLKDVFIPFATSFKPVYVAFGILSFYVMLLLIVTSYLKSKMPHKLWRAIHFLNVVIYLLVFVHALYLGTDLSGGIARNIFVTLNVFLGAIFLLNFLYRIGKILMRRFSRKSQVV